MLGDARALSTKLEGRGGAHDNARRAQKGRGAVCMRMSRPWLAAIMATAAWRGDEKAKIDKGCSGSSVGLADAFGGVATELCDDDSLQKEPSSAT